MFRPRPTGFTLVELLIVLAVASLMGAAIFSMNFFQYRSMKTAISRGEIEDASRRAMLSVVKVIREAQPSATGAYSIVQVDSQSITMYANIDADANIERVRFFMSGNELRRGLIEPVGSPPSYPSANEVITFIAGNIRNGSSPVFEYFNKTYLGSGPPLSQPVVLTDVRLVRMSLTVDDNTNFDPPASTLITSVQLRNLKDNY